MIDAFGAWQKMRELAPTTIHVYRWRLVRFGEHLAPRGLEDATRQDVVTFLTDIGVGANTRSQYLGILSTFYAWAEEEGIVAANPCRRVPRPRVPTHLPRPISEADLALALREADALLECWLTLGAYAGLRCKEIGGLRAEDVHITTSMLVVSSPKGHRQRAVPMHPRVEKVLAHRLGEGIDHLFTRDYYLGDPYPSAVVSRLVSQHFHRLGIEATAHMLRHRFGTRLYAATHDLRLVQEMMGHASPTTTAGYTQLTPGAAAEGIAEL